MNFEKAFNELKDGKKIRRKDWENLMHMRIIDGHVKTFQGEYTNFYSEADILISNGWLVVDGDGTELNFIQALEELKAKEFLTHKEWLEDKTDKFIFIDNGQIACCRSIEFVFMPTYKCLCATDWEILK